MTNTQHTTRNDQLARAIRALSVVTMRDIVLDNPSLFPECADMDEMTLTKSIAREHAHNRRMIEREQANSIPSMVWAFPAFLMVGMLASGMLALFGL